MTQNGIFKSLPEKKEKKKVKKEEGQGGRKDQKGRILKNNFPHDASFSLTLPKDCCLVLSKNYLLCLLFPVIFFQRLLKHAVSSLKQF